LIDLRGRSAFQRKLDEEFNDAVCLRLHDFTSLSFLQKPGGADPLLENSRVRFPGSGIVCIYDENERK